MISLTRIAMFKRFTQTRSLTIGIRREAKNRWERRVPLLPDQIERLIKEHGTRVILQPSTKRVVPDEKYTQVGAEIVEDLSVADVILVCSMAYIGSQGSPDSRNDRKQYQPILTQKRTCTSPTPTRANPTTCPCSPRSSPKTSASSTTSSSRTTTVVV